MFAPYATTKRSKASSLHARMPFVEPCANNGQRATGLASEKVMPSMRAPKILHRFFNKHYQDGLNSSQAGDASSVASLTISAVTPASAAYSDRSSLFQLPSFRLLSRVFNKHLQGAHSMSSTAVASPSPRSCLDSLYRMLHIEQPQRSALSGALARSSPPPSPPPSPSGSERFFSPPYSRRMADRDLWDGRNGLSLGIALGLMLERLMLERLGA